MSNHISLTVPSDDKKALIAGATMLLTLAGKVPEMELEDAIAGVVLADDTAETTPPPAAAAVETTTPPPTAAETTPPPIDVVVDKNGLPWDPRIHAGTKALLADGAWRYKQGVDRVTLVPQVEEELRTLMATSAETTTPPPAAAETTTPPPAAAVAETTPPPADSDAPTTFPAFLKAVSGLIGAGTTTMVEVNAVLNKPEYGIATIQLVNNRVDLIPAIWADLVGGSE